MNKKKVICPKCKKKVAEIIEGKHPWKAFYLVCEQCNLTKLIEEEGNPSYRHYGEKEKEVHDEYYEYLLLAKTKAKRRDNSRRP